MTNEELLAVLREALVAREAEVTAAMTEAERVRAAIAALGVGAEVPRPSETRPKPPAKRAAIDHAEWDYAEVARLADQAARDGKPVNATVAAALDVAASHAATLISRARDRGHEIAKSKFGGRDPKPRPPKPCCGSLGPRHKAGCVNDSSAPHEPPKPLAIVPEESDLAFTVNDARDHLNSLAGV